MKYGELKMILGILLDSDLATGMEITILDPELDPEAIYTKKFVGEIAPVFNQ